MGKRRAFRSRVSGFEDGIYFTESAGKARYQSFVGANSSGFALGFADIRITRAPEYDALAGTAKHGWSESFAKLELDRLTPEATEGEADE